MNNSDEIRARPPDERGAIARVATMVARGAEPPDVFAAVSREIHSLFRLGPDVLDVAGVVRFDPGPAHIAVGMSRELETVPIGSRWEVDERYATSLVLRTGRAARIAEADLAATACPLGQQATQADGQLVQVASPIVVNGRLWGAISINSRTPLPDEAETHLETFADLVATAIGNAESRELRADLIREQATLRRVATLVASGVPFQTIFSTVCEEVGALLDADAAALQIPTDEGVLLVASWSRTGSVPESDRPWRLAPGSVALQVMETGRPARTNDTVDVDGTIGEVAQRMGLRSTAGAPVTVGGKLWGVLLISSRRASAWAEQTEPRLVAFTDLIALAISNAEAVRQLERVAAEQAALKRVATLIARGASSQEVVDTVAAEASKLLDADLSVVTRHEPEGSLVAIASWSDSAELLLPIGTRGAVGGRNVMTMVVETGMPTRLDDYAGVSGEPGQIARRQGCRASIAAPISVNDRVWGVVVLANREIGRFPPGAEIRLAAFTDLVATALMNAQAQDELHRHVQEQAALQRVATLVAEVTPPAAIFAAVSREVEALFDAAAAAVIKFEHDPPALTIVGTGDRMRTSAIGSRHEHADDYAASAVFRTGRSARKHARRGEALDGPVYKASRDADTGDHLHVTSVVASPLTVAGQLWGAISVSAADPLPPDTERRLERFGDIVATAIANADSRQALATLASEQAGLRRIATQVAGGLRPKQIFDAVTKEIADLIGAPTAVVRFDSEGPSIIVEGASSGLGIPIGTRWKLSEVKASAEVYQTGRSARVDDVDWFAERGSAAIAGQRLGVISQVATPIIVDGHLWGTITVNGRSRLPDDTEQRMDRFTQLVATAIANAHSKSELAASRRRIVHAGDEARRRIERNLHDGIQQGLIELTFRAQALARKEPELIRSDALEFAERLASVSDDLREVSRGIHPTILSEAGLVPALRALARRSSVPADVDVRIDTRLPDDVEAAAYYVASEALANVMKHSHATVVTLRATLENDSLEIRVRDNGVGGVDPSRGSGILGIKDRIAALGGFVAMSSPVGEGTELSVSLPVSSDTATLLRSEERNDG